MIARHLTSAAAGLLAATLSPGAAPVSTAAVAASSHAPVKAVTKRFDVDGDRRADRVTLAPVRTGRYLLTVATARGRTVRVPVWSTFGQDWGENPWVTQGGIDGVPGAEIVLAVSAGDGVSAVVLTWRGGKLVNLAAPMSRGLGDPSRAWYWIGDEAHVAGYKFWTAGGQRKALACAYELRAPNTWSGAVTTSHWTRSGWREMASRAVVVPEKTARTCMWLGGLTPAG